MPRKKFAKYRLLFFILLSLNVIASLLVISPITNCLYAVLEIDPEIRKADSIILLSDGVYTDKIHAGNNYQRMLHAYRLHKTGYADKIIVCGGVVIKGMPSFAEVMKDFLVEIGINEECIITENKSLNTYENIKYALPILRQWDIKSSLLVTSSYHMYRSLAICRKLDVSVYAAPVPCYEKNILHTTQRARLILEVLREYGSIIYFKLRGWI
ncbi:MAG: YdcF family protein [Candidatus Brocadiaceae bacterium]|nr:YdcF family protein [Candidatus Brocadiaceae bacterium]